MHQLQSTCSDTQLLRGKTVYQRHKAAHVVLCPFDTLHNQKLLLSPQKTFPKNLQQTKQLQNAQLQSHLLLVSHRIQQKLHWCFCHPISVPLTPFCHQQQAHLKFL